MVVIYPGGVLVLPVDKDNFSVTIPREIITTGQDIVLIHQGMKLEIPAAIWLEAINDYVGQVKVVIEAIQLPVPAKHLLVRAYRLQLFVGETQITNFTGTMTLSFQFDSDDILGQPKVFWFNPATNLWEEQASVVQGDQISITTNHWSVFALMDVLPQQGELPGTGTVVYWLFPLGLAVAALGAAALKTRKRAA